LRDEPELVETIVRERLKTAIPRSVEFDERFATLQEALFALASKVGSPREHAAALTPSGGTLLYEDEDSIDSARLLGAPQARTLARWITALPSEICARSSFADELARLRTFYGELDEQGHALLSVRFRD
jgi:hypothetical protein